MTLRAKHDAGPQVPQGYSVVPISGDQAASSLRIGVLVRREPDAVAGHLVVLRDTIDAQALLGAVTDISGRVHRWVEIWIQCLDGLPLAIPAFTQPLTNDLLDRRWREQFESFQQLDPSSVIVTGWETSHPKPTLIDLDAMQPIHPHDAQSDHPWELCTDEALLESKQLPRYSTSLHRYLYLAALGEASPFIPVTAEAPTSEACKPMADITDTADAKVIALNRAGGLMMVRSFSPIGFEAFADLLGGRQWQGVQHGRTTLEVGIDGLASNASRDDGEHRITDGWLFLGGMGRRGRLIETLHLKLRLLADAISAVRDFAQQTQRPFFSLTPDSFGVGLGQDPGCALPFLWTAKASLVEPGSAITLPIQTSEYQYHLPADQATSVYHPNSASRRVQGKGSVRIRKIIETQGGLFKLEGTLTTQDQLEPARSDLIWLRLNLADGRVNLYAHLDRESAMAAGEWRLHTVGQSLPEQARQALTSAEGVLMADVPFETVPMLSSPCDLYALGVTAVRTLLVDDDTKLSVALDEVLSLGQRCGGEGDLTAQISTAFAQDDRWIGSLGPHRLGFDSIEPGEAFDVVPPQLWWGVLAMIVRAFPGVVPRCPCRDFSDAGQGGLHQVFEPMIGDLESLLLRTRSLIVIDWKFNREVHAVLRRHMVGQEIS